jgi:hypothetical protein
MSRWTPEAIEAVKTMAWGDFTLRFPEFSFEAFDRQRRRVLSPDEKWSAERIQRAVANNVKMARQVIRIRHSIEADDELAVAIPKIKALLAEQAHGGQIEGLSYDDLRVLIYGS